MSLDYARDFYGWSACGTCRLVGGGHVMPCYVLDPDAECPTGHAATQVEMAEGAWWWRGHLHPTALTFPG